MELVLAMVTSTHKDGVWGVYGAYCFFATDRHPENHTSGAGQRRIQRDKTAADGAQQQTARCGMSQFLITTVMSATHARSAGSVIEEQKRVRSRSNKFFARLGGRLVIAGSQTVSSKSHSKHSPDSQASKFSTNFLQGAMITLRRSVEC